MVSARALYVVWVLAGCGRLGFEDMPPMIHPGTTPSVCSTFQWTTVAPADRDVDLSVAVAPTTIAVGWIPHADGALMGLTFATDWTMTGAPAGSMLKPGGWVNGAVAYVDGKLVAGESENNLSSVKYDTVDDAFSTASEFGCPTARYLPRPPMLHAGPDLVAPTVFDDGLSIWTITNWSITVAAATTVATGAATGIAATEIGARAFVVWATTDACHSVVLDDAATSTHAMSTTRCFAPRVAANDASVALVYEAAGSVGIVRDAPLLVDPANGTLVAPGTSPRIAYDGAHFWATYLDGAGSVVVGYLDDAGALQSTQLAIAPAHDAYELEIIDHQPWVVALDAAGLSATRLCAP